jgi:hypothetical protein
MRRSFAPSDEFVGVWIPIAPTDEFVGVWILTPIPALRQQNELTPILRYTNSSLAPTK